MVGDELETARDIAARTGRSTLTARSWARRSDFPPTAAVGARGEHRYERAAVDRWLAAHPSLAGPPPAAAGGNADELVTLSQFASRIGKARGTVYQYGSRPPVVEGNLYRLGDLAEWWASRPGQGARSDLR